MIATKNLSNAIVAVAATALLAQGAVAQLNSPRLGSDISLYIDGGTEQAVLPVIAETAGSDLLTYDFGSNEIRFSAGVLAPSYDDPMFCFDMGAPSSPVSIQVKDPNGHVVVDGFELGTSLQYVLAAPSSLVVVPTLDQQCFYRSSQGVFGLFGQEFVGEPVPQGLISRDRFEPDRAMSVAFQGVPQFASPGQTIDYDLVVTNTGSAPLNEVALQELFQENLGVYAAALTDAQINCTASGGAVCPTLGTEPFIRFKNPNAGGIDMPAGSSLTFGIQRTVDASSITGEDILLHAGAVADPVATGVPFDVDEAVITVIGESAGLNISSTEAVADGNDSSTITVTVLDSIQSPVPNETVTFDSIVPATSITLPVSGVTDANGEVTFNAGTTTSADDYTAWFSSGTLNDSGTVTFVAGPPAAMNAVTTANNAVADGNDTAEFAVTVLDAFGNVVSGAEATVSDTGALSPTAVEPPSAFTDVDGNAFFTASTTTAGDYTVTFAVSGAGTESSGVTFTPGTFDSFAFVQQPTDTLVNEPMATAVTIELVDAFGNRLTNDSASQVDLDLRSSSSVDFVGSTIVSEGLATFSDITVDSAGTYYLRATVPGLSLLFRDSVTFDVTAQ